MYGWMDVWVDMCMHGCIGIDVYGCMCGCMYCVYVFRLQPSIETSRRIITVIAPYKKPLFWARPLLGVLISGVLKKLNTKLRKHIYTPVGFS